MRRTPLAAARRSVRHQAGRAVTVAAATLPGRRKPLDFTGWTTTEYLAHLTFLATDQRTAPPPRRAGRAAVATINRMSGVLPVDAVILGRSITDAAPPAGRPVNATLAAVLDRYLPESLSAFDSDDPRSLKKNAEQLLLTQLDLLHQVAANVQRAQAEHNDRDLQIQETFLRDRFADLTPGSLDLHLATPASGADSPRLKAFSKRDLPATPPRRSAHVEVDVEPVVLFEPAKSADHRLFLRLALPKGCPVTLGCVYENHSGAIGFVHTSTRRLFATKHPTGFRAPQIDVTLRIEAAAMKRFVIYVHTRAKGSPIDSVLFVRDADRNHAELATTLPGRPGVATNVVCSGYATPDGLVLRNESTVYATLQAACRGFGYGNVTWLDEHTPIV